MNIELVAAYVRVSHQEQKLHGLSLDAQKMKLAKYAKKNGMKVVDWYIDEGVSGRKLIRNRPELQRMILDAKKGRFERIIFIKLDRFFRSVAEYHECMKQISPVIWSTTEEEYDLTTANGRMLVNMKLTIAEMEADLTGERISIVNDYKLSTGQPLTGSLPFGFAITTDESTGRKKIIKDPECSDIVEDAIEYFLKHQAKKKTLVYLHVKYHLSIPYATLTNILKSTMLYGAYRDNKTYCEPYIDEDTFNRIQCILKRNIRDNTTENRVYYFSGLIKCPECGTLLKGGISHSRNSYGTVYNYKKYRCGKNRINHNCDFVKAVSQNVIEKLLLKNIGKYLDEAKVRSTSVEDADSVIIPKYDIEDINERIDRLNYSWKTGKIRKVEQYEKEYAELMEELDLAESERGEVVVKDFGKIESILDGGWKEIYKSLDDAHKRAFWRSFISSIEIEWTTEKKEIVRVNFF